MENVEVEKTENTLIAPHAQSTPNFETLKTIGIIIAIAAFTIFVTQSWKGDAGFPGVNNGDFAMHSYLAWTTADHISRGDYFLDWDYKSNALLSRARPILPYLIIAPFVFLFGLFQGISYFVLLGYFLLGVGMYFLGKKLNFSNLTSLFLSLSMLLSYALILEVNWAGGIHRLLSYAILPWILICFFNKTKINYLALLALFLAITMLVHPLNGIWFIVVLLILYAYEIIKNKDSRKQKHISILFSLLATVLLISPYFGPLLIEQANGDLIKPTYQIYGEETIGPEKGPIPESFINRTFGPIPISDVSNQVFGYLGISIMLISLIGILFTPNYLRIPFFLLIIFFYLTLVAHSLFPTFLQAYHYSRPLFMISFFLTILAAFAINKIVQNFQSFRLLKLLLVILLFVGVFIDLSPGITSFSNSDLNNPSFRSFKQINTIKRVMATDMWVSFRGATVSPSDFIIIGEENTNPEYGRFVRGLNSKNNFTENKNRVYLLGVENYLELNFNKKILNIYVFNTTSKAFMQSKVILIKNANIAKSEEIFEQLTLEEWFVPNKTGFILPRAVISEGEVDYVLAEQKSKPNEVTLRELPALFASLPNGRELPWGKDKESNLHVLVDSPGWVFVSQMWYPHWRVNGKPVQETGGGLIAFYADAPGEYKIYWERPWYDYVFWAISLVTLLGLIYAAIKPEFFEKLLRPSP